MSIFQESGNFVSFVYLNDIAVAAGGKQVFTVGRDVEVAGMDAGGLITYLCQGPIFGIHGKDGDAVFFQTVAGVEVFPIRTEVDVCTSTGGYGVGCDSLYLFQAAVVVTEGNNLTGQPNKELKVLFSRLQQNKNSNTTHTKLIITVSTLPHNRIPGCSIVRNHLRNPDAIIPAVLPAQSGKYILSFWFPPEYLPSAQLF